MRLILLLSLTACVQSGFDGADTDDASAANDRARLAPTITLTGMPPALGNSSSVTFDYAVAPTSATVQCGLDAQALAACPPPSASFADLADGPHTFHLRATSGGKTATTSYAFTIDTVAPVLALTSEPSSTTDLDTATFGFTTGDATFVTCALDGGSPVPCTSPWTSGPLVDGSHSFALTGRDAAGNTSTLSYVWTIDTVAPTIAITATPNSLSNSKTATFAFFASAGTTTCSVDAGAPTACTSPVSYTLPDGAHAFTVVASDVGGAASASYSWHQDTTAPSISAITYTCDSSTGELDVSYSVSDVELQSVTCTYAGFTVPCSTMGYSGNLLGPSSAFSVVARDLAGNSSARSVTIRSLACE